MKESLYNIWLERDGDAWVFNALSGKLLKVKIEDRDRLKRFLAGGDFDCSEEFLMSLAHGRMLIPDDGDELLALKHRYLLTQSDLSRFALTIVSSLGCNFDCPYCFEHKHPSVMQEEVQQIVLSMLDQQLPKIKHFKVAWFGGEPLVGKQSLFSLSRAFIERCNRAKVEYAAEMTTNGYLLDAETCLQLSEHQLQKVQISLDGPPDVHNQMRPLANGQASFWRIVENLHHAVKYFRTSIRVNVDTENFGRVEELFSILKAEGLTEKLSIYPGQIVNFHDDVGSPSTTYKACCFTKQEFAWAEKKFSELAVSYGFSRTTLPKPSGAPCTAVRANELVVGSEGELYKCRDTVGNHLEVIGDIRDYENPGGRLQKWLKYDPFADAECRGCIALPVCMGGCAHHAMDSRLYENRCSTFRHTYRERILAFIEAAREKAAAVEAST